MLDEAETLAEKAKAAIKAALADESSPYHDLVTFFMQFHRDDVGPDIAADLFPGTDPAKLSFIEMVEKYGSIIVLFTISMTVLVKALWPSSTIKNRHITSMK